MLKVAKLPTNELRSTITGYGPVGGHGVFQIQSFIIILDALHCSPLYPLCEVILYAVVCALLLYILVTYI